jgi:hypothetical protein
MTTRTKEDATLTSRLAHMEGFIDAFRAYRWRTQQARLARMGDFVTAFQEQADRLRKSRPARFNVFSMFKVGTDEVSHSAFLAWLLDARGSHRQGNLFLKAFLDACRPIPSLTVPDEYRVQTEYSGLASVVDILVYRAGQFVLYIENKTASPDTPGQSDREFSDMRRLGARHDIPPDSQIAVYLTPQGRQPPGAHAREWRTAAYADVGEVFDKVLPLVTEDKVRFIIDDWLDTVQAFGGVWRQRMATHFSEESIFIARHWDTVVDILRAKAQLESELSNLLLSVEAELKDLKWWDEGWVFEPYHKDPSQFYIANQNWRIGDERVLWLGVYHFDSEHIFGSDPPPQLYVRVGEQHEDLQQVLGEEISKGGYTLEPGYYFVGRALPKCLMEEEAVREYPDLVRRQIVDFLDHYVQLLMQLEDTIRRYVADKVPIKAQKG